jgi:hypothetical protein
MLTERARRYLATLKRRPALSDPDAIADALREAGVPPLEVFVRFQVEFGGYGEWYGLNRFVWGIVHDEVDPDSAFDPGKVDGWMEEVEVETDGDEWEWPADDEEERAKEERWYVTCADCHLSDHWMLDSRGWLLWCGYPRATSFETKIERDAFLWELGRTATFREVRFDAPAAEVIPVLRPRVAAGRVAEASDELSDLFLADGLYVSASSDQLYACVVGDGIPSVLEGLPHRLVS